MMRMRWKSATRLTGSSRLIILRWSIVHRQSQITFPGPPDTKAQTPDPAYYVGASCHIWFASPAHGQWGCVASVRKGGKKIKVRTYINHVVSLYKLGLEKQGKSAK